MSATITTAKEFARRRQERDKQRRERQLYVGSILEALDDDTEQRVCVASKPKETTR